MLATPPPFTLSTFLVPLLRPCSDVPSCAAQEGRDGIEAEWEKTDEFHEKWRLKAREFLANVEWRKRKLGKRVRRGAAELGGREVVRGGGK